MCYHANVLKSFSVFWGQKKNTSWDLESDGSRNNGAKVRSIRSRDPRRSDANVLQVQLMCDERVLPCRTWKFILVKTAEAEAEPQPQAATPGTAGANNNPPQYQQEACCSCACHDTETKDDDGELGTTVVEVTTVTKTTRRKYRVPEDHNDR